MPTTVHQCPRCELRFLNPAELRDHFSLDHHADPDTFDRYRYSPASMPAAAEQPHRYLIVANQTLVGEHLARAVAERAALGPTTFFVLVPATHSGEQRQAPTSEPSSADAADDAGLALARWRLRTTIDRLHDTGVVAEGQIGHPDPLVAVGRLLRDRSIDEILLSTLPPGFSKWLGVDLPHRLERRYRVPVTVLTGELIDA